MRSRQEAERFLETLRPALTATAANRHVDLWHGVQRLAVRLRAMSRPLDAELNRLVEAARMLAYRSGNDRKWQQSLPTLMSSRDENRNDANNQTEVGKLNRLLTANEDWPYRMEYDDEGNLIEIRREVALGLDTYNHLKWDHRGRLIEVTAFFAGGSEKFEFEYDALNRLIGRKQTDSALLPGQTVSMESYAYDGGSRLLESDLEDGGKVTRTYLLGVNGEVLATDEVQAGQAPYKVWMFPDTNGNITTVGTVDFQGNWKIQHRRFQEFGIIEPDDLLGDRNTAPYLMDDVPVIWNGGIRDHFKGALRYVYQVDGRWFDEQMGRFLSEDPMGYQVGRTNLYLLNGNDPFPGTDYSATVVPEHSGPSPFGTYGALVYGMLDTAAFGHFDDLTGWQGARGFASQHTSYYVGMAGVVGAQIAASILTGGAAAAGPLSGIARAYAAYNVVGDVVGIYDSVTAFRNGTFGPLDALGFAPSVGLAFGFARGVRGLASSGRIAGNIENAAQASRAARSLDVNPSQLPSNPVVASAVEGVIPRCFTANTEVLVRLPEDYETDDDLIASLPVTVSPPDSEDSGSSFWMVTGATLVAVGVHSLASSVAQKRKTKRQQQELSNLDLAFCDYERMEAAVV